MRQNVMLLKTLSDYKRIMRLIATNEVVGLRRLITAALRRGASPAPAVVSLIEQSIAGLSIWRVFKRGS